MEEDEIKMKYERMKSYFITEQAIQKLAANGIWRELINALSESDYNFLGQNVIKFCPLYSPASHAKINHQIPAHSHLVIFDVNALCKRPPRQAVAILLHELGHIAHPSEGEFGADRFASERGFALDLISDLEEQIRENPKEFNVPLNLKRVEALKKIGDADPSNP
ncbi:MAG: hypothetical protein K8H89_05710 [Flavobacteriales bacterium]|nr:hypothetical protein [Flavobacteriales bacterium]